MKCWWRETYAKPKRVQWQLIGDHRPEEELMAHDLLVAGVTTDG